MTNRQNYFILDQCSDMNGHKRVDQDNSIKLGVEAIGLEYGFIDVELIQIFNRIKKIFFKRFGIKN